VELRNRLIEDDEAIDLFRRCSLVVLPYVDATQSALIAAAYFFGKPVIVTRTGALPEYVIDGETGWVIEPRDPQALAECLLAAFSDPARLAEMGKAGRAWYEVQRRIEHSMLLTMYRQAAAAGGSPRR
jgi:alpha-maltose-1-phosphate synthase